MKSKGLVKRAKIGVRYHVSDEPWRFKDTVLGAVGVTFEPKDFTEWAEGLRQVCKVFSYCPWEIGDRIVYAQDRWKLLTDEGKKQHGTLYAAALKSTGLELQTLYNLTSLSRDIPTSRRREVLSWSHHAAVAGLTPKEQDKWLALAEENEWTRGDLRQALRANGKTAIDEPNISIGFVPKKWANEGLRALRTEIARLGPIANWQEDIRTAWKRDLKPLFDIYTQL